MFEPKPISKQAIPTALEKAERYRLLNDASSAESICRDVLEVEPDNQAAVIMMMLAITDQFAEGVGEGEHRARELLPRIRDDYRRAYYDGVICERRAKAQLKLGTPGAGEVAYEWFRKAMTCYEQAEGLRPAGNDESILRWNTCARILNQRAQHVHPRAEPEYEPSLE